jgi:gliding motility-associated-like protein
VVLTSSAASGNLWSNNETTPSITVTAAGTFTVSYTQAGCKSPASAPVTVSITNVIQPTISANHPSLCPGTDTVILDATTTGATYYLWNNSATQASIGITTAGTYYVTVTVSGCQGSDSITITAQPLLGTLSLTDSFSICQGDTVTLDATTANATSYQWSSIGATTPKVTLGADGIYFVTVSNNCGSIVASTVISVAECECRIVMPNAFTPNGDGVNDVFAPSYLCNTAKYLHITIYNRWGEKVYDGNDLTGGWDGYYRGTPQPPGVYIYLADFAGVVDHKERVFHLKGSLTVIR